VKKPSKNMDDIVARWKKPNYSTD